MGVPAFFRWLSRKYPLIVKNHPRGDDMKEHYDNLYLDMNGIIHPCTHPEDKPPPQTEDEMFIAIQEYIEMIMKMVKPKKLLYMAVDGVAPRAKMNQQRSRRFRAVQETEEKKARIDSIIEELKEKGVQNLDKRPTSNHFDSNVITPGTNFMMRLSQSLIEWINKKLESTDDPLWHKDLIIILSDASVPGEGEHKIMDFLRRQKSSEAYNPNTSHCLLGADADLIMLGLVTHEVNFTILREEFIYNQPKPCEICAEFGHENKDCLGPGNNDEDPNVFRTEPEFIAIRLCVLREYLEKEADGLDLERFIDDWVFLCFFVGNDFLPHLPSLEIREGAVDRLVNIYKEVLRDDYTIKHLTKDGIVDLKQAQKILHKLGQFEDEIFRNRKESDRKYKERLKRQKALNQPNSQGWQRAESVAVTAARNRLNKSSDDLRNEARDLRTEYMPPSSNREAAARLKSMMKSGSESDLPATSTTTPPTQGVKRKKEDEEGSDSEPEDEVQLGTEGWKDRYYFRKFGCAVHTQISQMVAHEYVKGLCWVLLYYYQGCPDWQWFYPYHYAPFASDFRNIVDVKLNFSKLAKPFKPLEQLMSVFPAASSQSLPDSWRKLMSDPDSPIIDFYPINFHVDLNGKKAAWMGVPLLPFIDESRLKAALEPVYPDLTESETERNSHGRHLLFVSKHNKDVEKELTSLLEENPSDNKSDQSDHSKSKSLPTSSFNHIAGTIEPSKFTDLYKNVFALQFDDPVYGDSYIFPAKRHQEAAVPAKTLTPQDQIGGGPRYGGNNYNNNNSYQQRITPAAGRMINASLGGGGGGARDPWPRNSM